MKGDLIQPIEITDKMRKEYPPITLQLIEVSNNLMNSKLCGYDISLDNGWKISLKNKKFAKNIGCPM